MLWARLTSTYYTLLLFLSLLSCEVLMLLSRYWSVVSSMLASSRLPRPLGGRGWGVETRGEGLRTRLYYACNLFTENFHCIFLPVLSLPLGKTTVMHMIVKDKLPDEQSTGESVYHKLQALTSASVIPCYAFQSLLLWNMTLDILCVIERSHRASTHDKST